MSEINENNITKFNHPFIRGNDTVATPPEHDEEVDEFLQWIRTQERLPQAISRGHALLFLHACEWNMKASQKAIQKYFSARAASPDIFSDRDPLGDKTKIVFDMTHMAALPEKTPEGYHILTYRLSDTDPTKFTFSDALRSFCSFNDVRLSEDGLAEGYVVVFDMKGLRLGHLARVTLGPLRAFMTYIQEAHPARLKKIYVVHTSAFINQIMALVKPLIRGDLMGLLSFTQNGPSDFLPVKCLPVDYGGPLTNLETLHAEMRKTIEEKYRDWLIDSEVLKELPKKSEKGKSMKKIENGFRGLEID